VIQYALDQHVPSASQGIILQLLGNVAELSTQMFSSHVVEKVRLVVFAVGLILAVVFCV